MISRLDTQLESIQNLGLKKSKYDPSKGLSIVEGVFDLYDTDHSGCLKKTEFLKFLTQTIIDLGGEQPSIDAAEDIMDLLDKNGDGQISKSQILVLFQYLFQIMRDFPQGPQVCFLQSKQK